MINNTWQVLGVGLMDTREIASIVASNTARIDLPKWLRLEPYCQMIPVLLVGTLYSEKYTVSVDFRHSFEELRL